MPYRIITHSGKAHIDEMIASALVAVHKGEQPQEIIRMEYRAVEKLVSDGSVPKDTWVLDCGLAYNPGKLLFDHHHDGELPCCVLIIVDCLFPELRETSLYRYFELLSKVDLLGDRILEDSRTAMEGREYWRTTQSFFLKSFEKNPVEVVRLLTDSIKDRIGFEDTRNLASEWLDTPGNIRIEEIKEGVNGLVYLKSPPADLMDGLHSVDTEIINKKNVALIYGFDKQDHNIRTLFRTSIGHNSIDFSHCKPKDSVFCHQGGFLLRFIPQDEQEWHKLVLEACRELG